MSNKKNKKFVPKNKSKESKKTSTRKPKVIATTEEKLNRLVPVIVDAIGKLFTMKGARRDRDSFTQKVQDIMDDKEE